MTYYQRHSELSMTVPMALRIINDIVPMAFRIINDILTMALRIINDILPMALRIINDILTTHSPVRLATSLGANWLSDQ